MIIYIDKITTTITLLLLFLFVATLVLKRAVDVLIQLVQIHVVNEESEAVSLFYKIATSIEFELGFYKPI